MKRFDRLKAIASLDAYQITNCQFPLKLIIFLLPDFRRIREEISKSGILWSIVWAGMIKRFIWFFLKNYAPRDTKVSCSNGFKMKKRVFIEMNLLPTVITNSFKIQNQTFEKHFHFLCWLYDREIYSFLEKSTRFIMKKVSETQVHSFHTHADIKAVFTFLKKHIQRMKTFMIKRHTKLSLVDPLS